MTSRLLRLARHLAVLLACLAPLFATADPPTRVGRLSLVEGQVSLRTDRQDAGAPATPNWPIAGGAIIDTAGDARAEIWIGSTAFRLGGASRVEFTAVDGQRAALYLAQGSLAISLHDADQSAGVELATPVGQIRFGGPGRYRIEVDAGSGDTQVTSRDGLASVFRPGGRLDVASGQRAVAFAGGGWFVAAARPDALDNWADARDSLSRAPTARRYLSPDMTGYQDLDRYGNWGTSPAYGEIWYPSAIPAGWAPYRYGRWAWVPPWGWTWVDAAPWGFAPFHYGRWVLISGQWAWVPGAYTPRPVYAPALVAWIGSPGWSVGFSSGASPAVGWFPLAPREVFVPAYQCSPTYVRQVNITHVTNVTVIEQAAGGRWQPAFAHRDLPQAVTVAPARAVQSGSPIESNWHRPDRRELAQVPVAARAPGAAWLPPAAGAPLPRHEAPAARPTVSGTPAIAVPTPQPPHGGPGQQPEAPPLAEHRDGGFPSRRFERPLERPAEHPGAPAPAAGGPDGMPGWRPPAMRADQRPPIEPAARSPLAPPPARPTRSESPRPLTAAPHGEAAQHPFRHPGQPGFERPATPSPSPMPPPAAPAGPNWSPPPAAHAGPPSAAPAPEAPHPPHPEGRERGRWPNGPH